jgi:Fe-S-cluster containining protein
MLSVPNLLRCLPAEDQKVIRDMMALFADIDRQTERFTVQTGLKCKSGCGACCMSPEVETTVAEVLPLAAHLWFTGQAESTLETIRSNASKELILKWIPASAGMTVKSICVFYKPDAVVLGQGQCGIYAFRPGICRLFGFAARKDKHGQPTLVTCKVIKDSQPQVCKGAQEKLQKNILEAPLLTAHAFHVFNIDPVHGEKLLPINQAIGLGLERVGYNSQKLKQQLPIPAE